MGICLAIIFFFMTAMPSASQSKKGPLLKLLQAEQYHKVLDELSQISDTAGYGGFYAYIKGVALFQLGQSQSDALEALRWAAKTYPLAARPDDWSLRLWFDYAQALHGVGEFTQALELFRRLEQVSDPGQKSIREALEREVNYCENAIRLSQKPVSYTIHSLGKSFNTPYQEHSPVVSLDENQIIFTSNRPSQGSASGEESLFYSIWREGKWLPARKLGGELSHFYNNASVSLSADGKTLILYHFNGKSGDLYYSTHNKNQWSAPEKYPSPINSAANETHASLSADGRTIYFVSDRLGGLGGKDIYLSRILPDGSWGPALNLGSVVNTALDEESPFVMPDGEMLYFASEGHESMGGFDVFRTRKAGNDQWIRPENIGYPVNTPRDDLFYCPTPDGLRVYCASDRDGTKGQSDLYLIEYPSDSDIRSVVVAGFVYESDQNPAAQVDLVVEPLGGGEVLGVFKPNPATGKYVLILQSGKSYQIRIEEEGYQLHSFPCKVPARTEFAGKQNVHYLNPVTLNRLSK